MEPLIDKNEQLLKAVEECEKRIRLGETLDREEILERHPEIREELASCLSGLELVHQAGKVVESKKTLETAEVEASIPLQIGDFRLRREVGRGGMGIVYEAEQISLNRRVALKVLPFAAGLDHKQIQRFKNEAQAAAQLHHTGIVPVYSVGCERGVYYYAMEYVLHSKESVNPENTRTS
ncbi:MAG: protein kinase [Planctomycetes bacterium]|nr:protein kinase [Planctomycetota bacterium]